MSQRKHSKLSQVARQTRSAAAVGLTLPIRFLFRLMLPRLIADIIHRLQTGVSRQDLRGILESTGVATALHEFQDIAIRTARSRSTAAPIQVMRLAGMAEDLALDDGGWRQGLRELELSRHESEERLGQRVSSAVHRLLQEDGPAAAQELLEFVERELLNLRKRIEAERDQFQQVVWTPRRKGELTKSADNLRQFHRSQSWTKRMVQWLMPDFANRFLLSSTDRFQLQRAAAAIAEARRDRQQEGAFDLLLRSIERLVGTAETPGFLTEQLAEIDEHQRHWQQIIELIPSPTPPAVTPEQILVIKNLDTVIGSKTVYDLGLERLERGGFTPTDFAEQLRREGLFVQGRTCLPDQWRELHPAIIATPLLNALKQRLGAEDTSREINFLNPTTPLEHFGGLTMTSDELASYMMPFVKKVARQVNAFAIVRPINGADPRPNYFFFCHDSQRTKWEDKFRNAGIHPCVTSSDLTASDYRLPNPHRVVFVNGMLGIPGGALDGLLRWKAKSNRVRRELKKPALFPQADLDEVRIIGELATSHEHCEKLFEAAKKARLIYSLGQAGTHWVLAKPEPRVAHVFEKRPFIPSWQPPKHFQQLLKETTAFALFIEREFPQLAGFRHEAKRLSQELQALTVAIELKKLGVLTSNQSGQFQVTCRHNGLVDALTEMLFTPGQAQLVGLTPQDFIATLQDSDDLHNILFFAVLDAFQLGELAEFDVPNFVLEYARSLD